MTRLLVLALLTAHLGGSAFAQAPKPPQPKQKPAAATPAATLKVKKDFKVELLYSVPKDLEGSWVNMCSDPKGRLIVSDQYGGMFRITPPAIGEPTDRTKVEKIDLPIGEAQGLLWAFDSLYIVVNAGGKYQSGLYRAKSKDQGDTFEKLETLRKIDGGGEHGPHAVMLTPDGKNLTIVCGNQTRLMKDLAGSKVPLLWGEDHILPRMPDGNGFMAGVLAPGGCMYNVDPDGKNWELLTTGYRNQFDAAYNRNGDLFTYDADMEWDFNTPWYRPTRVCMSASGGEFGWRNGAGKWPAYYPDSLPPVVNVGPGSPTGVAFGYGAKFPAKYQDAFFICDWSYGKLYATHMTADGAGYKAELEEFISGTPLPLTDVIVDPKNGAMYFTIGGRRTQSGLYRVTYVGSESTATSPTPSATPEATLRKSLEAFHGKIDPAAVAAALPALKNADRYVRFAARVALEHQPVASWSEAVLTLPDAPSSLTGLLALVRASASDPQHRKAKADEASPEMKAKIAASIGRIQYATLTDTQKLEYLRLLEVYFVRYGLPTGDSKATFTAKLSGVYPSAVREQNAELCQLLIALEAPDTVAKTIKLLSEAPTQEEQIEYARALRVAKVGWNPVMRASYFTWMRKAQSFKGGNSLRGFLKNISTDAVKNLSEAEKTEMLNTMLQTALPGANANASPAATAKARPLVKAYKTEELTSLVEAKLTAKRSFDKGRKLFGEANCFSCHRYDSEGGSQGPDLTGAAGRFALKDLLESMVEPSKVISDQYAAVNIAMLDGKTLSGRIVNHNGDNLIVMLNMLDPNGTINVNTKNVETIELSKLSMMPSNLLDTFTVDEIGDLCAYILSRGDRSHKYFQ